MPASDNNSPPASGQAGDGFRRKYIAERLKELDAERERLVEERRAIMARRKAADKPD